MTTPRQTMTTPLKRALWLASIWTLLLGVTSCGESFEVEPLEEGSDETGYLQHFQALTSMCSVNVQGGGTLDVETEYLPGVVACENGNADFEALKAQAIAARTFLKYKVDVERVSAIRNSQRDQVSSCGRAPSEEHRRAVEATRGQVLTHRGTLLASFYVSGVATSTSSCRPTSSEIARASSTNRRMEERVTYNQGQSGSSVRPAQRPMGDPSNRHNRGVMSQNGSDCLAEQGRDALSILRFYYGDDVELEQLGGDCGGATPVDQGPPRSQPSTPGNPQTPGSSGVTDTPSSSASGGSSSTPSAFGNVGSCLNAAVAPPTQPRSVWGATAPQKNRPRHAPDRITFHQTSSPDGMSGPDAVRQVQNWHKDAYGLVDIAYHYIIDRDGTVYTGTPANRQGAHQMGQNEGNLGVAFIGSFGASPPSAEQIQSGISLALQVGSLFGFNLDSGSILGGFLSGGGASELIATILKLIFGGGDGMSGDGPGSAICTGSVDGTLGNGVIEDNSGLEGTPATFEMVRLTALASNGARSFPLDAFESIDISAESQFLVRVLEQEGVKNIDGASALNGTQGCDDITSGKIMMLPAGASVTLGNAFGPGSFETSTGLINKIHSAPEGVDFDNCQALVGGKVKVEFSMDGTRWSDAGEFGINEEVVVPTREGVMSGGGGGGGGGGTPGHADPNSSTLDPSGPLGGNQGSGGAPSGSSEVDLDASLAQRLVAEALKNDGADPRGWCWREVKRSAARAGLTGLGYNDPMGSKGPCSAHNYQLSAYCGGRNWNANPQDLASTWGFTKLDVHPTEAPAGSIIFWDKSCNGYHSTHGHVEIAVGGGRACSDFCGAIRSGGGSCSYVFAPTGR